MKKLLAVLAVSGVLVVGCGNQVEETTEEIVVEEAQTLEQATIFLMDAEGNTLIDKGVEFEEGQTLAEVMEENFELESEDGFVTGIEGHSQSPEDNIWLVFTVNGEMISTGIEDTILEDGDEVVWTLEQF